MKCALSLIALCALIGRAPAASPVDDRLLLGTQLEMAGEAETEAEAAMTEFQLPTDLVPQSYELHVEPHLDKADFDGHVAITVKATSSVSRIHLNAKHIKLASGSEPVRVTRINVKRLETLSIHNVTFDVPNEQMYITLDKALSPKATYKVEISYTGLLGNDMMGFYLSRYSSSAGKEKLLASTQFEPTGARRAFPCFDEPKYKTPFTIKITRDEVQKAISNMPLHTAVPVANSTKVTDTFQVSPNMPTYLVGFAVFEFECITNNAGTFRVWGREDVIKTQGQYIFEKGQKILKALGNYMGIDYYSTMPKMDLVAVPDFDAGAMENWGMNTYREIYLLSDPTRTKSSRLEDLVATVTHEFSHQWFGDLVTPASWNEVWLNEAFATFFEYAGTEMVEPDWRMEDLFVVEQVQVAFNSDLKGSHAMTSVTTTPQSIADTFDHIIYNKGGSVLRMIEHAITPKLFRQCLQGHLRNGASDVLMGTVEPANLWDAFDEVLSPDYVSLLPNAAVSITDFVDEWVNKPGFPLVTVTRNYATNIATVTQQRFLLKKSDMDADTTTWTIPITYTTKTEGPTANTTTKVWFPKDSKNIQIALPESADWFLANVKEVGFYRVNYDVDNWRLLVMQLNSDPSRVHILNRAQLLDDAFTLAQAGQLKIETALELTQYLKKEVDFIPWYSVYSHLRYLMNLYSGTELGKQMKIYVTDLMDGIFTQLGLEEKATEQNMDKLGRSSVVGWICHLGHSRCTAEAADMFRKWIPAPEASKISPNIKDAVYCTGIRLGTADEWAALWNYYLKTDLASEKVALLYALGCSKDENILYKFLTKITDKSGAVRTQDHYIVIRAVIDDTEGVHAGLKFLQTLGPALLQEAKQDEQSPALDNLKSIVSNLGASVKTEDELGELVKILEPLRTHATIASSINKTLTHVEERFHFRSSQEPSLSTWFSTHTPSTTPAPKTSTPQTSPVTSPSPVSPNPPEVTTPKSKNGAPLLSQLSVWLMLISLLSYVVC